MLKWTALPKSLVVLGIAFALAGPASAQAPSPGTPSPSASPAMKAAPPAAKAPAMANKAALLDINSAAKADLVALKGIGDKRADDIIKGRPYKGKDELVQKKIIPAGVYAGIKDQIIAKQK